MHNTDETAAVQCNNGLESLQWRVCKLGNVPTGGIEDQQPDIQRSSLSRNCRCSAIRCKVKSKGQGLYAVLGLQLYSQPLQWFLAPCNENEVDAARGEFGGKSSAESLGGTCDDGPRADTVGHSRIKNFKLRYCYSVD